MHTTTSTQAPRKSQTSKSRTVKEGRERSAPRNGEVRPEVAAPVLPAAAASEPFWDASVDRLPPAAEEPNVVGEDVPHPDPESDPKPVAPADSPAGPAADGDSCPPINDTFLNAGMTTGLLLSFLRPCTGDLLTPADIQILRQRVVAQCEFRGDVIEQWLVEALMMLRFVVNVLYAKCGSPHSPQELMILNSAACRSMAELRRTVATLSAYRESCARRRSARDAGAERTPDPAAGQIASGTAKKPAVEPE